MKKVKINSNVFLDGDPHSDGDVAMVDNETAATLIHAGLAKLHVEPDPKAKPKK